MAAITSEIKKRRKATTPADLPVSLNERRALDKENAMQIIREHKSLLNSWDDILTAYLRGQKSHKIFALNTVGDFVDGFELSTPTGLGIRQL